MSSHAVVDNYAAKLARNRLGLWLFLISDSFLFVGLFVTRVVLLGANRPELNQVLGFVVTVLLLFSSFFMNRAEVEMAHGNRPAFLRNTFITMALGVLFLAGVVGGGLGILIGGLATMAPGRRDEVVSLGVKSIVSGTLATCLLGAIVGILE